MDDVGPVLAALAVYVGDEMTVLPFKYNVSVASMVAEKISCSQMVNHTCRPQKVTVKPQCILSVVMERRLLASLGTNKTFVMITLSRSFPSLSLSAGLNSTSPFPSEYTIVLLVR